MTETANTYDELPYSDHAYVQAHPDRLAVIGMLYGLTPPPVQRCSVLELGCGLGGHLLPMATVLPESRFVGIDLSAGQIELGRQRVEQLGIANVELRRQDLMDFGDDEGPFDYIICHGVYSWVPPAVQERILRICKHALAPHGLATISYNVRPGWGVRSVVRDILRHGSRDAVSPAEQVAKGLEFLRFVARSVFDPDSPYGQVIRGAAETLSNDSPTYVFHEYLEECNEPIRFEQFVERARDVGLRYIADATLRDPAALLTEEAREHLNADDDDMVGCEQTIDYLAERAFRRDVLCHDDLAPSRWPDPTAVREMHIIGQATPATDDTDAKPDDGVEFSIPEGPSLTTTSPGLMTALRLLHQVRPAGVPYAELLGQIQATIGEVNTDTLERSLLACAMSSFAELHTHLPRTDTHPGERPAATAVARCQAETGKHVANLLHRNIELDAFARALLALLDGTRDRAALVDAIAAQHRAGVLKFADDDADLPGTIGKVLDALAGMSLLIG